MMYTRRGAGGKASKGSGESEGSGGGGPCPGSLQDCIVACPTEVAKVYTLCVANCGRVCGNKLQALRTRSCVLRIFVTVR